METCRSRGHTTLIMHRGLFKRNGWTWLRLYG